MLLPNITVIVHIPSTDIVRSLAPFPHEICLHVFLLWQSHTTAAEGCRVSICGQELTRADACGCFVRSSHCVCIICVTEDRHAGDVSQHQAAFLIHFLSLGLIMGVNGQ